MQCIHLALSFIESPSALQQFCR